MMASFADAYRGKQVFVTGHTGFKGSWLCEWLLSLGANVTGYSLPPETRPALFEQLGLARRLAHHEADVRDAAALAACLRESAPDFVFHLAAQPLVRESYVKPRETFDVNGMGTLYVLEALRELAKPCAAVFVTTDKCYENREWVHGYREEDPLGGRDPYSASKAVAELIIHSYRQSFFPESHPVRIASARAGNVIGGGDWAKDRIVPDCVRALERHEAIPVRNKTATRPWQHVLEPLSGYLWLAASLAHPALARCAQPARLTSGFNFGPTHESNRTVAELVGEILKHWPGQWQDRSDPHAVHEANLLQLSTDKAHSVLGWSPVWNFPEAIEKTIGWYRQATANPAAGSSLPALTVSQIDDYFQRALASNHPWASAAPVTQAPPP